MAERGVVPSRLGLARSLVLVALCGIAPLVACAAGSQPSTNAADDSATGAITVTSEALADPPSETTTDTAATTLPPTSPSSTSTTASTTSAPPVEESPEAPTASPVSPDSDGLGFSPGSMLLDLTADDLDTDLDRMVALGADWIRIDLDWSRIEAEEGSYDWTTTDAIVTGARSRDLRVLGLIAYTPAWARPAGTPDKAPPIEVGDFARYVEALVDRYGRHIRAWEIWNEPNVSSFWHPEPDPAGYAQLLDAGSSTIRRIDPDAVIVTGGLAPALDLPGIEVSPLTFLEQLYDHASSGSFDAVGVHPYTYPGFPTETQDWNQFAALPDLRDVMIARGDETKTMWITEYGAPTGEGQRSVSAESQATMISEAITELEDEPWAGPLFVYSLRDVPNGSATDIEANFGVLRADGEEKPAAAVVRQLAGAG